MAENEPFMLVAADDQIEELTRKLMRIGLDNLYGYVQEVTGLGIDLVKADIIDLPTLGTYLKRDDVQVVDLRGAAEYEAGHIEGADHVFVGTLAQHLDQISRDKQVVLYCQGGDRATIGYSLLRARGFTNVSNFSGSMNEWQAADNPVVGGLPLIAQHA